MADVKAPLYTSDGTAKGDFKLDADVFGIEPNLPVLHQVITAQLAAKRSGTASTKTRAEVRGGGRKPWRQKGLGRARQGSIRAPHWVGGGIAHGPKPHDFTQRTPKKMKRLALRSALSAHASEEAVMVIEDIDWSSPKTKQAVTLLEAIGAGGKTLVVLGKLDGTAGRLSGTSRRPPLRARSPHALRRPVGRPGDLHVSHRGVGGPLQLVRGQRQRLRERRWG